MAGPSRSNPSSIFEGAEKPAIEELAKKAATLDATGGGGGAKGSPTKTKTHVSMPKSAYTSPYTSTSAGATAMANMLSGGDQKLSQQDRAKISKMGLDPKIGSEKRLNIKQEDGTRQSVMPSSDGSSPTLEQLRILTGLVQKNTESIDGMFAELRAISNSLTELRQDIHILKESSARFPSQTAQSQVKKVFRYDP